MFLDEHGVLEVFQSAFVSLRIIESALFIFNDIFLANDSGDNVILVLLDLTAAFDTVDQTFSIQPSCWLGGTALDWFRSSQ